MQGTLLFVSHNRSFLNGLATVIWDVKDFGIVSYPGNLDDWLYHEEQLAAAAALTTAEEALSPRAPGTTAKGPASRPAAAGGRGAQRPLAPRTAGPRGDRPKLRGADRLARGRGEGDHQDPGRPGALRGVRPRQALHRAAGPARAELDEKLKEWEAAQAGWRSFGGRSG